jgi:hypothetical protein
MIDGEDVGGGIEPAHELMVISVPPPVEDGERRVRLPA